MEEYYIHRAVKGDKNALAYIQTESWKAAFRGIVPDGLLAEYTDITKATEMYRKLLDFGKGNGYILEIGGKPHCIAFWDSTREAGMPGYAELICIHSLKENWHRGYGSRMIDKVLSDVRSAGYSKIMLWVFKENKRAIGFYESKGFVASTVTRPAMGATEIMYTKELEQ